MKKTESHKKTQNYYVSTLIIKIVLLTIGTLYILQFVLGISTYFAYPQESLSKIEFLSYQLLPVVIFMIAYIINPRKISRLGKALEGLLLALTGFVLWVAANIIFTSIVVVTSSETYNYLSLLSSGVVLVIIIGLMYIFKLRGTWK